ncbi:MAG: flagellar hook-basal body complex protein FliE [Proteobacteria bacterium]|nr:flagellar hook-basal body complex protein FliE [Pseudomonadota bacterium]MBS0572871.1 flagellar hook-basal body complex protein FliE [Pseudomonadota bacterium]
MDVRTTLASLGYGQARPATAAGGAAPSGPAGFGTVLNGLATTLKAGEDTARAAMTSGADPHALVQALASSELAVETAVTLRDKVVEAYQEILRMQI